MREKDRKKNTETYHFYNANPKGLYTGDCRYRAYALASGVSWEIAVMTVALWSVKTGSVDWNGDTMDAVLQEFGPWQKQKEPKHADGTKYTVAQLAKTLKKNGEKNPVIVSINHHVTTIKDGKVWDIWDCSNQYVRNYWTKGE